MDVGITLVLLCVMATCSGLFTSTMVELRKRKNKRDNDDISSAPISSQSDDAVSDDDLEADRRKSKRKKEDVESSKPKNKRKSTANSGPHKCRFCKEMFDQSQALGGHMNKHRFQKEEEEVQKAQILIAKKQQYIVGNSWNMQGGSDGNLYDYCGTPLGKPPIMGTSSRVYYNHPNQPSTILQNSQINQVLAAQQNAHIAIPSVHGGGYNYNSVDSIRSQVYGLSAQRNANPIGQYQAHHGVDVNFGLNSGQQYPVQTVLADSKPVMHGGTHALQAHGSILHSNQGGLQDIVNMASNNQQGRSNIPMASFHHRLPNGERTQFVDEHGNPVPDHYKPGQNFQILQDYTHASLDQKLGTSMGGLRSESADIRSEHNQAPGHGVFGMPSMDADQDFQGGTDQSTTLMEPGQAGFETDTSIDDHTSARLQ